MINIHNGSIFKLYIYNVYVQIYTASEGWTSCLIAYPTNPRVHFDSSHVTRSDTMQGKWKGFRIQDGVWECREQKPETVGLLDTEVPVHPRNVQNVQNMTSVRSWKSPLAILILLHQRDFFKISQHQTKERLLSDIMLQENPKRRVKR